jgi:hypothetical protein
MTAWRLLHRTLLGALFFVGVPTLAQAEQSTSPAPSQKKSFFKPNVSPFEKERLRVTCKPLILGMLTASADGRAAEICQQARMYCIVSESLKWMLKTQTSPFADNVLQGLGDEFHPLAERWCLLCAVTRAAFENIEFNRSLIQNSAFVFNGSPTSNL